LKRWIERYEELEKIKKLNRKPKSYKITKKQVRFDPIINIKPIQSTNRKR
jgi:hypothetical protein